MCKNTLLNHSDSWHLILQTVKPIVLHCLYLLWHNTANRRNHYNPDFGMCLQLIFIILMNFKALKILFWVSTPPKLRIGAKKALWKINGHVPLPQAVLNNYCTKQWHMTAHHWNFNLKNAIDFSPLGLAVWY